MTEEYSDAFRQTMAGIALCEDLLMGIRMYSRVYADVFSIESLEVSFEVHEPKPNIMAKAVR